MIWFVSKRDSYILQYSTAANLIQTLLLCPAAMSSYLFIVKSELPLVIQAFLGQTSSSE